MKHPYYLTPQEYGYLLGHRKLKSEDRQTQIKRTYSHWEDEEHRQMCHRVRKAIDEGDTLLRKEHGKTLPDKKASNEWFFDNSGKRIGPSPLSAAYQDQKLRQPKARKPRVEKVKLKPIDPNWILNREEA
jgi:hypothetical protein